MSNCGKCRFRGIYDKNPKVFFRPHLEMAYWMVSGLEIIFEIFIR